MMRSWLDLFVVVRSWLLGLAFVLVLAGCSNSSASTETELTASGPCLNGLNRVFGESGLTVAVGDERVLASLDFEELRYCPGHEYEGQIGQSADGFLATLDETVLQTEPGSTITVSGPGYPGAKLRTGLAVMSDVATFDNGRIWELQVPEEPGRYEVDLFLDWEEGKAHYAFVIDTGVPQAGGPCLDSSATQVGDPRIVVAGVRASPGSSQVGYCPGVDKTGAQMGDGFFYDLEEALIRAEQGETILVTAPGYPGATMSSTWRVEDVDGSTEAEVASVGAGQWSLVSPDAAAVYILGISLEWPEGRSSYAVRVAVGDVRLSPPALVPVEPDGDSSIHPTLLPVGFVKCDEPDVNLRFCDPTLDYAWLEMNVETAGLLNSWGVSSHNSLLGAIDLSGAGSRQIGVLLDSDTVLVLASSGIRTDLLQQVAASIPAFDSEARSAECRAIGPSDLLAVLWMCDLEVGIGGDMVESDILRFGELANAASVRYQFTPVLKGTAMTQLVIAIDTGDLLAFEIEDWRQEMVLASGELGFNATHADPGNYTIDDLILIPASDMPSAGLSALLDRLVQAGFEFEMKLRTRF